MPRFVVGLSGEVIYQALGRTGKLGFAVPQELPAPDAREEQEPSASSVAEHSENPRRLLTFSVEYVVDPAKVLALVDSQSKRPD
jgi:hypothetical protein